MRQIFLDTETTGLYPAQGHRIIEIAAVEVINRRITSQHYHVYLNPDREIDAGAQEVHGITLEFLQDKPRFADVVGEFLDFVQDSELIIHNAPFDVGFLNAELGRIEKPGIESVASGIIDTLKMAKEMRPGQRNNLDALCRHFGIDNSKRTLHGALLDAELLADVYLAMTRGQESLIIDMLDTPVHNDDNDALQIQAISQKVVLADETETAAHQQYLQGLAKGGACVWQELQQTE
ncbi:DNA polymerase III subunit epsilon [Methylovorus glucosotrophus]|jgi:DNA polymerase III subunit epsilon|uniref:DNA polymerase III subunit epsilon n=1 Tax=Methylovorus glucosotrophus (strain SIP3-4) TaxID=582744 RepID=C6XDR8_METGS|nr:DNA polymerase III subunit epsilon [Methylovorus glucosotrophus]ACT50693.1 DNA polymerase III, epsilon subunit [Methylovorus glucosotrophus SIP3-4]KAF0843898.1 DNA polymerase-3 subunit epsilon [Methylovorus glucosotrophus]